MMTPQERQAAYRRRKGLPPLSEADATSGAQKIAADATPRHDPWRPKRHPAFLGRLKRYKRLSLEFRGVSVRP
jgi:hypothetical protein